MEKEIYDSECGISLFYAKNGEISSFRINSKGKTTTDTIKQYEKLRDYCLKEQEARKFVPR